MCDCPELNLHRGDGHCRNQYGLTHTTVPESPRAMLVPLENTEQLFIEKYHEKAKANKAKAATAYKTGDHVTRKRTHEGSTNKRSP